MKIKDIKLDKVVGTNSKIVNSTLKEFVLVGRSNVGKSSFINAISGRKNYARTSSTPGKTRTINYYLVDGKFYLVDLPGYGYAKVSIEEQNQYAKFINKYLKMSEMIADIIQLVDIRHEPTKQDVQMFSWTIEYLGCEPIIVATKCDKIKKTEIKKNVEILKTTLNASDDCIIIPFSSETKVGVNEILKEIELAL